MDWQVLVVEDTADDSQLVSTVLQHSGIVVQTAINGREALNVLENFQPNCIITDLNMPVMDGWELLESVRSTPELEHIPMFAVTAYYSSELATDALKAGFHGFFAKPINPRSFVSTLISMMP